MTEAVGREVQLVRINGVYRELHGVTNHGAMDSWDFGREQMCEWCFWWGSAVCGKSYVLDIIFKLFQLQLDTLIFHLTNLLKKHVFFLIVKV